MFVPSHFFASAAEELSAIFHKGIEYSGKALSLPLHEIPEIEADVEQLGVTTEQAVESTDLAFEEAGDSGQEIKERVLNERKIASAHTTHTRALRGLFKNYGRSLLRNTVFTAPPALFSVFNPELVSTFIDHYRLAFLPLAVHMALKAEKAAHHSHSRHHVNHKMGEAPNPDEVLGEDVVHRSPLSPRVSKFSHYSAALETAAAVLFLIHELPWREKVVTSSLIMVGMPTAVLVFSSGLVLLEDSGQRLQNWKPTSDFGKVLAHNDRVARVGLAMEAMASPSFGTLQILGECLQNIGIARVVYRALPLQETYVEHLSKAAAHYSPLPQGFSEWGIRDVFWCATGFVVGKMSRLIFNKVKTSTVFLEAAKAARALTMVARLGHAEKTSPSKTDIYAYACRPKLTIPSGTSASPLTLAQA